MSVKIAVITTGGTINGLVKNRSVDVEESGSMQRQQIDKICKQYNLDLTVHTAMNKLSEDIELRDWAQIIASIQDLLDKGFTRIVMTHGTDTMAYTAAVLGLVFGNSSARICITGAYYSFNIEDPDGPLNLVTALRAVALDDLPCGVYAAFRTNLENTEASIYPALSLKSMEWDKHTFTASHDERIAIYRPKRGLELLTYKPLGPMPSMPIRDLKPENLMSAGQQLAQIIAYPGLNISRYDTTGLSALVVGLYHCGTAPSQNTPGTLIDFIQKHGDKIPVFLAAIPTRYLLRPYESTVKIGEAGGRFFGDIQPHVLYVYLVLGLAAGMTMAELCQALLPWQQSFTDEFPAIDLQPQHA